MADLRFLWTAVSLAGGMNRDEDIADIGAFVASLGLRSVATFKDEVRKLHTVAAESGLRNEVEQLFSRRGGKTTFDPSSVDRAVEYLALAGRKTFSHKMDERNLYQAGAEVLGLGFAEAVDHPGRVVGTVDPMLFSGKAASLQRDGSPWIRVDLGFAGGADVQDWPFMSDEFLLRVFKAAAICSQQRLWQELRKELGRRSIDVVVLWCPPGVDSGFPHEISRPSRQALEIGVRRDVPSPAAQPSAAEAGNQEAREIMSEVHERLTALG
ncbi:hypothetical protein ASE01_17295 [Nocardioides sp. Root190]|nr:hypothetical protein ASE01_17295 [Nocardioides sp. Root190]